jgi:NAD(P)-dependent dehydrogenase (short-subunit alcohol dehydrogenase family)
MRSLEECVVLVTGSTDGLGKQIAHTLAAEGARLIVHGRNTAKVAATLRELREASGNDHLSACAADFSSLQEVHRLANQILTDHARLDAVVNNAGIGFGHPDTQTRETSQDGYELRFAVNYLAPFLLTRMLEPLVVDSRPARIVNVCSAGQGAIDFDDVMLEAAYDGMQAYRQSKLALVMFTFDLADELRQKNVTVNCLHPATFMPTKMVLEASIPPVSPLEQGVRASVRLIVDPALDNVTGVYFDGTEVAQAHAQAYDMNARRSLRELSAQLVGLRSRA